MPGYIPPNGVNDFPVSGTDWADGTNIPVGTPTPDDALIINVSPFNDPANDSFFEELPDSPEIELGEVITIQHRFRCDWNTGVVYQKGLPRGAFMVDSTGVFSAVLNTKLVRMKANTALFTVIAEAVGDPPQDECTITPSEFNLALEKHPRYHSILFYNLEDDGVTVTDTGNPFTGPYLIQYIKDRCTQPQLNNQAVDANALGPDTVDGWDDPVPFIADAVTLGDLITELIYAYRRGETEFYLAGWEVKWTQYYFNLAPLQGLTDNLYPADEGGYVQDPVKSGFLPPYFWSVDGTNDTSDFNNILARLPVQDAVNLYDDPSVGQFSWLKFADEVRFERNLVRQTRTWVGGPLGIWDLNIYPVWTETGLKWQ